MNDADRRRLRRFAYLLIITLAGGLGAASIWRVQPLLSANDRSRWATVRALVEFDARDERDRLKPATTNELYGRSASCSGSGIGNSDSVGDCSDSGTATSCLHCVQTAVVSDLSCNVIERSQCGQ